ncbi:acyl-CoA oxidase [Neoconidiobolus thromboides FSU 785]|nr:acyl-CoA oxidase [Neoconidiobolus thromboides FSU 785]
MKQMDYVLQQRKDIIQARSEGSIDIDELTSIIYDKEFIDSRLEFEDILKNESLLDLSKDVHLSRPERYLETLKACKRLVELKYENNLNVQQFVKLINYSDLINPLMLDFGMFETAIRTQTSSEQYDKWYKDVLDFKMLGCYAQTELGHGSSLSNLETTATLDKSTDEWVINSPTLSSAKFWPGALGKFSNHAIVYAQLIIDNKSYGPHGFLTPIRSYEDHKPLKGIILKDIGPKLGYEGMDNGYATFNQVRIPRENMLMGFSTVSKEGVYKKPPHSKIGYAVMTQTRVGITQYSAISLARAITIAIRYCLVRRQGVDNNKLEPQVIDYPLVQYRLFPILASTFSLMFVSRWMLTTYQTMMSNIAEKNDFSLLPEVHAISSALKGYCSEMASNMIEEARRALGGQGYLKASGLSEYYNSFIPSMTYEGENGLLTQQTARFLLKQYKMAKNGQLVDITKTSSYILKFIDNGKPELKQNVLELNENDLLIELIDLFSYRAYFLLKKLNLANQNLPWDALSLDCYKLTKAQSQYLVILQTYNGIQNLPSTVSQCNINILKVLLIVHIITILDQNIGDFFEAEIITSNQLTGLRVHMTELFKTIRPEVARLTDAFKFTDRYLKSDLGPFEGNVYEKIVDSLDKNPLNTIYSENEVIKGYKEYIQPLVHGEIKMKYEREAPVKKVVSKL